MGSIPSGVYKHKGGGRYRVLFVVEDSTNSRIGPGGEKNEVVVYVSLTYGKLWCRDLAEFVEEVVWPDGERRPRFVLEDTREM